MTPGECKQMRVGNQTMGDDPADGQVTLSDH